MFSVYSGVTADEVWVRLASAFRGSGAAKPLFSRSGLTRDLGHVAISILDPRQRWVLSRRPAMNPAFAIAEVIWILNGRNDSQFLNFFNRQLPRFAGTGARYDGAYGWRLRRYRGIDQLDRAYHALANCDTSRQVVLQIWDARADLPNERGAPSSPDVPCNLVSLLKVREGVLEWTQVMRSTDMFRGLPHNFVQFTTLHEVIAGWLGARLGHFHLVTDSLHVYDSDLSVVDGATAGVLPANRDSLALTKNDSDEAFRELSHVVDCIISPSASDDRILGVLGTLAVPQAFRNLLCVVVAECLRRRSRNALAECAMEECSNVLFVSLWNNWRARLERSSVMVGGTR